MRAIHLPGHTRGHCALLAEPAGVLFLGDIDLTGFGPYYGDAWSYLEDFERSLARVRELPARVWVSFHHAGVITERAEFLAKLDRFAGRIAERERACSSSSPRRARSTDMVAHRFLYPPHAQLPFIDAAERRTITPASRSLRRPGPRRAMRGRTVHHEDSTGTQGRHVIVRARFDPSRAPVCLVGPSRVRLSA